MVSWDGWKDLPENEIYTANLPLDDGLVLSTYSLIDTRMEARGLNIQ